MSAQVRLDLDVTTRLDEERGDDSRAHYVNELLRDTFDAWDEAESVSRAAHPSRRRRHLSTVGRVRPTPRRW